MTLGHNHITLGGLPFSALMTSAGQGIPGLPFTMQSAALGLGLGGMLATNQRISGVNRGPEGLARPNPHENENASENGKENERYLNQSGSSNSRERHDGKNRESRKRMRSNSLACESDDDIMVLSNSPSSNEPSEQRDNNAQSNNVWDNPPIPMGLGFSMANPSLVNNSMYSSDASSFMAAMGPQMPYDVRKLMLHIAYFTILIREVCSNLIFCCSLALSLVWEMFHIQPKNQFISKAVCFFHLILKPRSQQQENVLSDARPFSLEDWLKILLV